MAGPPTAFLPGSLVLSLLAAGCGYDPGHDYSVTVTWLINGVAPSKRICDEYGIDRVRLTVEAPDGDTELDAPCDQAATLTDGEDYGAFETGAGFDYGVIYTATVEMLDARGRRVNVDGADLVSKEPFQVFYGDPVPWPLATLELVAPFGDVASFSAAWDVGEGDVADGCQEKGIETVAFWIASADDTEFRDAVELANAPCVDGEYVSKGPVLAEGSFVFKYVALDRRGAVFEEGAPIDLVVSQRGEALLPREHFGRN